MHPNSRLAILLVEPDPAVAESVRHQVAEGKRALELSTVVTLEEALQRLKDPGISVVLLDLDLPDCKGLDTLKKLRSTEPDLPIIVLSSSDSDDLAAEAIKHGAQETLSTRFIKMGLLHRTIKTAMARKSTDARLRKNERDQREDFAAMLAHDLKIPVAGANRIFDLMLEGWLGPLSSGQQDIVIKLRESNNSVLRLIQNMLEVYSYEQSKQPLNLVRVELLPLLMDSTFHFNQQAMHGQIHIKSKLPDHLGTIKADAPAIKRLFLNVLDNAIKYSPAGGTITVEARSTEKSATIMISDQGPGIPARHQTHLFDRFWLGGPDTKYSAATGLGLYLCKRIVEAHSGSIRCKSEEGKGTVFTIKLPLIAAAVVRPVTKS